MDIHSDNPEHGFQFPGTFELSAMGAADRHLESDLPQHLMDAGIEAHCMRDLTRGGLGSALNEIAQSSRLTVRIREDAVPVLPAVAGACEMLGFDPLYVACEGRFVLFVPPRETQKALDIMTRHACGACARTQASRSQTSVPM